MQSRRESGARNPTHPGLKPRGAAVQGGMARSWVGSATFAKQTTSTRMAEMETGEQAEGEGEHRLEYPLAVDRSVTWRNVSEGKSTSSSQIPESISDSMIQGRSVNREGGGEADEPQSSEYLHLYLISLHSTCDCGGRRIRSGDISGGRVNDFVHQVWISGKIPSS